MCYTGNYLGEIKHILEGNLVIVLNIAKVCVCLVSLNLCTNGNKEVYVHRFQEFTIWRKGGGSLLRDKKY